MKKDSPYTDKLTTLLLQNSILKFGEFRTKSGRLSPYFLNFGEVASGGLIKELGNIYAEEIVRKISPIPNTIFGPAYKGIPLAVSVSQALEELTKSRINFSFNRKEVKDHGEGGTVVGAPLTNEKNILIVEDVITAGTTISEIVPMLRKTFHAEVSGVLIAVDREEKINPDDQMNAVETLHQKYQVNIISICKISTILEHIRSNLDSYNSISRDQIDRSFEYLKTFGTLKSEKL